MKPGDALIHSAKALEMGYRAKLGYLIKSFPTNGLVQVGRSVYDEEGQLWHASMWISTYGEQLRDNRQQLSTLRSVGDA